MNVNVFKKLQEEGLISDTQMQNISTAENNRLFSLHWEIKTILYLGVLLLSGGLGTLVYKNIDTIGHQVILLVIALVCAGCYAYCFKHKAPFSWQKVNSPNSFFDYALLLGSLTFVTFIGYLQFQYTVFGTAYGLATFIPMLVLFFTAYYFDHLGILSMAITNLAAWAGIAITPMQVLSRNDFGDHTIIFTGMILGVVLMLLATLSAHKDLKKHFSFTYHNFGVNIFFIAGIAAMLAFEATYGAWFLLIAAAGTAIFIRAFREKSFYFAMISILYVYIALSILIVRLLDDTNSLEFSIPFYAIVSAITIIILLINLNKKLKQ